VVCTRMKTKFRPLQKEKNKKPKRLYPLCLFLNPAGALGAPHDVPLDKRVERTAALVNQYLTCPIDEIDAILCNVHYRLLNQYQ
jgi:hypothetical protein